MSHAGTGIVLGFGLALGLWSQGAMAGTNLLTNGSFETLTGSKVATQSTGAIAAGAVSGWTLSSNTTATPYGTGPGLGVELVTTDGTTAAPFGDKIKADPFTYSPDASGTHALYFVDDGALETLSQSVSLVSGLTYEIGFDLYQTPSGAGNSGLFTLAAAINGTTLAAATQLSLPAGVWVHFAETYLATSTGNASFVFTYSSGSGFAKDVLVDDVYVEAGTSTPGVTSTSGSTPVFVPEPGSMGLLAGGVAALAMVLFSRRTGRSRRDALVG